MKRGYLILGSIGFLLLILLSFIYGVYAEGGAPDFGNLENDSVVQGVNKLQETIEERRWEYLSKEWKSLLLKNKYISSFDGALRKVNLAFVVLLGRDYDLSLELFIAFVLWVITLIAIYSYSVFLKESWMRFGISLAGVVILAQIKLFNIVSGALFKMVFYKSEWWWSLISFLAVIVILVVYYVVNRVIASSLKASKEKRDKEKAQNTEQKLDIIVNRVTQQNT